MWDGAEVWGRWWDEEEEEDAVGCAALDGPAEEAETTAATAAAVLREREVGVGGFLCVPYACAPAALVRLYVRC